MNPKEFVDRFCRRLTDEGLAATSDFHGYSSEEILRVEEVVGQHLPQLYKTFLGALGKGGGAFMRGTHMFMKDPKEFLLVRDGAIRLMAQSKADEPLPENAFVFADHQGYQFWYFITGGAHPDPEVFYFHENWRRPERKYSSLSDCLTRMLSDTIADAEFLRRTRMERDAARAAFRSRNA